MSSVNLQVGRTGAVQRASARAAGALGINVFKFDGLKVRVCSFSSFVLFFM